MKFLYSLILLITVFSTQASQQLGEAKMGSEYFDLALKAAKAKLKKTPTTPAEKQAEEEELNARYEAQENARRIKEAQERKAFLESLSPEKRKEFRTDEILQGLLRSDRELSKLESRLHNLEMDTYPGYSGEPAKIELHSQEYQSIKSEINNKIRAREVQLKELAQQKAEKE